MVRLNAFEGARRVAWLVAGLWVIGWVIAAFATWDESVRADFEITAFGAVPALSPTGCGGDDKSEMLFSRVTPAGTKYWANLCFRAHLATDGRMLIPFRSDGDKWLMNVPYSPDVSRYTERVKNAFSVRVEDEAVIDSKAWPERFGRFKTGAFAMLVGLAVLWAFTAVTGWVVRGFLGIPRGEDRAR